MTPGHLATAFVVLVWFVAFARTCVSPAEADASLDREQRELSERVWRTCINEGGLVSLRDCSLIWQVVEGQADTTEKRIDFIKRHSPRVHGLKPCAPTSGNCRWVRGLSSDLTLPAELAADNVDDYWRVIVVPRAKAAREHVDALISGAVVDRPCPIQPRTWGGLMDHEEAIRSGLYPIGCEGTLNDGFAMWQAFRGVRDLGIEW